MFGLFKKNQRSKSANIFFERISLVIKQTMPRLKFHKITEATTFEELEFNSIDYINLLLSLEDVVNMDLEEIVEKVDLSTVSTIGGLVNLIASLKHKE
ncbi:MAG: hypothetical protein EOO46_17265 [Flavobacterium sp.]|nr:MAG: hypothetical protein EOO46_17265 [Flavobacterium sp.]